MKKAIRQVGRAGFTLIEILVVLILLAVLAAFLVPGLVQQLKASDAPRMANDLTSIRTAVTTFTANVPPVYPGDLEDLVYQPFIHGSATTSNSDVTLTGQVYTTGQRNRWNGEYLETLLTKNDNGNSTGNAFKTGFNGDVQQELRCFNPVTPLDTDVAAQATRDFNVSPCTSGDFVAIRVIGVTEADFQKVNDLIDGDPSGDTDLKKRTEGKLRWYEGADPAVSTDDVIFYLAAPFRS